MSAAAVGAQMPAEITLDDVAEMAAADENHRYELSSQGGLSVMPPASPEHALVVSRIAHWFYTSGFGPEQVTADCGIFVGGGRQPDLTVWAKGQPPRRTRSSYAGVEGLLLAIEVVSPATVATDHVVKKAEYAAAGIPRYWIVDDENVRFLRLADGAYAPERPARSLAWLLNGPVPALG